MNSSLNVLIPDGNSTWALAVINCLSEINEYKLFVLSDKKRTATKFSRYTSYYKYYKRDTDTDWLHLIINEVKAQQISVIIPIAENEIQFFIRHKHLLPATVKIIPLPFLKSFETATNKHKLSLFLDEYDIPHPKFFYAKSATTINESLSLLQFPILLKPLSEKGGDGIVKFDDRSALDNYLNTFSSSDELFIQEYILGYDIDCSVLCLDGEVLTYTIQKGNLKGHSIFAPQLSFEFIENDEVIKVVKQLMKQLNWSGVAHIDMRYDSQANNYKVIEVNARFWGSLEGSKYAGVNFPDLAIQLTINNKIEAPKAVPIIYMRLKGVLKSIKYKPWFIFKTHFLLNHTEAKSFLKDPLPTFYKFREWFGRLF
ncbi:ATP-grasp domain-containing protein [uncultured Psychroserpens sp.]|uniref:ATP-grasp domain-containing protein n=1 Tax=uncultured Psychroserpens sp. TaxID=255436 RepID=UPI00262F1A70|nr:ATP-grasp domain-containing protein [uncultured Psychroserpens sp.]